MRVGKKETTIVITYITDYTEGIGYVADVQVGTSAVGEEVEYATLVGILEMAKIKLYDSNRTEE